MGVPGRSTPRELTVVAVAGLAGAACLVAGAHQFARDHEIAGTIFLAAAGFISTVLILHGVTTPRQGRD